MDEIRKAINNLSCAIDCITTAQTNIVSSGLFIEEKHHVEFLENYKESIRFQILDCVQAWGNALKHEFGMKDNEAF